MRGIGLLNAEFYQAVQLPTNIVVSTTVNLPA